MKVVSYNVNGVRAAMNKGLVSWLIEEDPDIVCLQEIKALEEQINICLLYTSPSPRDMRRSRMPSSA